MSDTMKAALDAVGGMPTYDALLSIVRDLVAEIEGGNMEPSSELLARANAALAQVKGGQS